MPKRPVIALAAGVAAAGAATFAYSSLIERNLFTLRRFDVRVGPAGTVSVLWVPLLHEGKLLALLTLSGTAAHRFDDDDSALLGRFAAPAANAIFNAQRYEAAVFLLDRDLDDLPDLPELPVG